MKEGGREGGRERGREEGRKLSAVLISHKEFKAKIFAR